MAKDPLTSETSLTVQLEETGLKVKAKSRFIAAFDRLCGNWADRPNPQMERQAAIERAKTAGEEKLIEATVKYAIDRMGKDEEFAERAIRNYLGAAVAKQENKDAVMREALEDLRHTPVIDNADSDELELDPLILSKLERHAEDASTDAMRAKWGRIVAAEIRTPGTFTAKVIRMVDEITPETALLFEKFCENRAGRVIPKCLRKLTFQEAERLTASGLIVDPGTGQVNFFRTAKISNEDVLFMPLDDEAIVVPHDIKIPEMAIVDDRPLSMHTNRMCIPVYVLTDEGRAIANILPPTSTAIDRYIAYLRVLVPSDTKLEKFKRITDQQWEKAQ